MRCGVGSLTALALLTTGFAGGVMMRDGMAAPAAVGLDAFSRAMAAAMERMHADMMRPPSGDPDRDFAAMMIPHHQGAIEMAKLELAHGKDLVLRRLAQGIIVEQGQEIAVMQGALATLPAAASALRPSHYGHHHDAGVGPVDATGEIRR